MKKTILLILISTLCALSVGCSVFRIHKTDIEQGNIITQDNLNRLHPGMTEMQVKEVMGNPVLMNIFTPYIVEYVYTFQEGHGKIQETRVTLIFNHGRLQEIKKSAAVI
ncbi:MAG TPA: outer membrane protein assembly factor BamE [Gammaproteobacteria bacterium]|nr:outer membrane protein assembly factor BamE [Gammaproteobacteria bacterium]